MQHDTRGTTDLRLAELIAALSLATDLGMGQPLERALCSRVLAVRLGDALGFGEEELRLPCNLSVEGYIQTEGRAA